MKRFLASAEIYFGDSGLKDLSARLHGKYSSVGLVYDINVYETLGFLKLIESIKTLNVGVLEFPVALSGEPTYGFLNQMRDRIKDAAEVDLIVAVGGGSVMDLGKGLAVLLKASVDDSRELRGMNKVKDSGVDTVLVPTTAGTGSEMTFTASFIDENSNIKLGINGDNVFSRYAVLMPEFILEAPKRVVIGSALDALVHASEALSSIERSDFTTPMASAAIHGILSQLPTAIDSNLSMETRLNSCQSLMISASMAGLAMLNSSGGIASAISYPVGARFQVPHGFAGGIPLINSIDFMERQGFDFEPFLRLGEPFSTSLKRLYSLVGAPTNFSDWRILKSSIDEIADAVLREKKASLANMPVSISKNDIHEILTPLVLPE